MDYRTSRYYSQRAGEAAERFERFPDRSSALRWLAIRPGTRLLDVGCRSGCDLAALAGLGCDVWGVEPTEELRREAFERHPELVGRIEAVLLPALGVPFGGGFESALCSAVLMHLRESDRPGRAAGSSSHPGIGQPVQLSAMTERPGVDVDNRADDGRLFVPVDVGQTVEDAERRVWALSGIVRA